MGVLSKFHLVPLLGLVVSAAMLLPAGFALQTRDWAGVEAFLFSGGLGAIFAVMLGLGTLRQGPEGESALSLRHQLASVILAFFLLPVILAVPVASLMPATTGVQAYFEMLSALTTTGATLFEDPDAVPPVLHLWRALVGWFGGALMLTTAIAILEPMHLGGFEIEATVTGNRGPRLHRALSTNRRAALVGQAANVLPAYASVTGVLALGLIFAGDPPFVALCHALSVLSTSGITPLDGLSAAPSGHWGEGLILLCLVFALSRRWLIELPRAFRPSTLWPDPELKLALICIVVLPLLLFLRHFISAVEVEVQEEFWAALRAYWGGVFTVASFLATFGLESRDWSAAQDWSGLPNSGVFLLGLALMGGGVATTAGGVKLLRIYALYKHGLREMRRLVHPNSVGGSGMTARRIRREGAYIAWIFLMLFALGIAASMLLLSAQGVDFEPALALSIAALTNTGPAISAFDASVSFPALTPGQLAVISVIMVVGRLETLVFIAFLNPVLWRE